MYTADAGTNLLTGRPVLGGVPIATLAAIAGLALFLAGCGTEAAPTIGNGALPPSSTTTSTAPIETTTTIDFSRPPDQQKTTVPENATAGDLAEIVDDMRGPTEDVAEQMLRLATFVELSSPVGSQITDLTISVRTAEELRYDISSQVALRGPQTLVELTDYYDAELRSLGWNKASETDETIGGIETTTQVFRVPGTAGDETELTIRTTGGPVSVVDIGYHHLTDEDDESFGRLAAWQRAIRTPNSGVEMEVRVSTADDVATLAVVHWLTAETAAQARADVVSLIRAAEFEQSSPVADEASTAPVELADESGQRHLLEFATTRDPEIVEMVVSTTFGLRPID